MRNLDTTTRWIVIPFMLLCCSVHPTEGQVVPHPNQIVGTIELTSSDEIMGILQSEGGFRSGSVIASSIDVHPPLQSHTGLGSAPDMALPYETTVEAGEAGIQYHVRVDMRIGSDHDTYRFTTETSDPVECEPADDVQLDFSECAALLEVTWQNPGDGAPVSGGRFYVYRETSPGSGAFRFLAQDHGIASGSTRETVAIRGDDGAGRDYVAYITFFLGTDASSDLFRFDQEIHFQADCGETVEIVAEVPGFGELGEIVGEIDMLNETENAVGNGILMRAEDGPFGSFRYDAVDVPQGSAPGFFRFENLLPSDSVSPPKDYRIWGTMSFRLGRRYEYFLTPFLDGVDQRVPVSAGETTDLGDTFVMNPGWVQGNIFLAGPPPGELGACLSDVYRASDQDNNGDGIPDSTTLNNSSQVRAYGQNTLATNASRTAFNGYAAVLFEGDYESDPEAFVGDYEIALGGLGGENTIWSSPRPSLRFRELSGDPETHQDSRVTITDGLVGPLEIVPGQTQTVEIRRCFGQLNLGYESTETNFYSPFISGTGSFSGDDFEENPANYIVSAWASGTPTTQAEAALDGLVIACLPEGVYDFTPWINSINPSGGDSSIKLPPVQDIEIQCGQIKNVRSGLQVNLDLEGCSDEPAVTVSGAAIGTGSAPADVVEAFVTVNGSPISICTDCGQDPSFEVEVPLEECANQIEVTAKDVFGNVASTSDTTVFDDQGPVLAGCHDVEVEDLATQSAVVEFDVTSTDNCDSSPPVACDVPPGSTFPPGTTEVTCSAADSCGNTSSCSFTVGPPTAVLVIQDQDSQLFEIDPTESLSELVCEPLGAEINNAGLRRSDGMIYAVELTTFPNGNHGIVRIDPDACTMEHLGSAGLPADQRFDAGDVSRDGTTLFVNRAGLNPLYAVDLTSSPLTSVRIDMTGARGYVHDWAYRVADGRLYGGDSLHGQLAVLDPQTGFRSDVGLVDEGLGELPAGTAYGGAWFDAEGRLVLHRNDGQIYVVDVDAAAIVRIDSGRASLRNEAAGRRPSRP